jgi:hypothetical protein
VARKYGAAKDQPVGIDLLRRVDPGVPGPRVRATRRKAARRQGCRLPSVIETSTEHGCCRAVRREWATTAPVEAPGELAPRVGRALIAWLREHAWRGSGSDLRCSSGTTQASRSGER